MTGEGLRLDSIVKAYGATLVLNALSLDIAPGEVVALLGPSGSGKTTLLRLIAGLEAPDDGRILWRGRDLAGVPPHARNFGYVFQDYALFPHRTVAENIAFGLRMQNWAAADIAARVAAILSLVNLQGFGDRAVYDLSGGEQQRVALGRSLAPAPPLLLLDEPLGALDRALRERLMLELRDILNEAGPALGVGGITAVYVTHDQDEAFAVADRLAFLDDGRVVQAAAPEAVFARPATTFVAAFLGLTNLLPATVVAAQPPVADTALGALRFAPGASDLAAGRAGTILIRPEAAHPAPGVAGEPGENVLTGRVTGVSFRGRYRLVTFTVSGEQGPEALTFEFDRRVVVPGVGDAWRLALDPAGVMLLDDH